MTLDTPHTAPPPEPDSPKPDAPDITPTDDTGLIAFAALLAMHQIAVDPAQLRHSLGHHRAIDADDLARLALREARDGQTVQAKVIRADFAKLERLHLPALANGPNGWFLIGRVAGVRG